MSPVFYVRLALATTLMCSVALSADAQSVQPRWEVDLVGGVSVFTLPTGGTAALPLPGAPLTTSSPTNPTRRVSTWFLGDGAGLLNATNAEFGVPSRITPLDGALASLGLEGTNAPAFGLRVRRRLTDHLSFEISGDLLPGSRALSPDMMTAIEATSSSFKAAFTGLLASGPFTNASVTSASEVADESSRELATTAAIRWTVTSGPLAPYVTLGGGLIHQIGDLPSVTLTGSYQFRVLDSVPISETDTLRLRYEQGSAIVGVAGAGFRGTLTERLGFTLDGRVFLGQQTLTLRLDSTPTVTTGSPTGFVESSTTPGIQFSNNSNTGRESSLTGTPLNGFKAFTTSGLQTRYIVTAGITFKF